MGTRGFLRMRSPARLTALITMAAVVLVSGGAAAALLLWPADDEFGFAGFWKDVSATPSARAVIRIELLDDGWAVTGDMIGNGQPQAAHLEGRSLVLDDVSPNVRFTVDESRNHLTMTSRSAAGQRQVLFVRTRSGG
jgi:hypothetical protein